MRRVRIRAYVPRLGQAVLLALIVCFLTSCTESRDNASKSPGEGISGGSVSGTFAPAGPPANPPTRVDAGQSCIVDLQQSYTISGSLSGTLDINFRINVDGPCGEAMGTFDEDWIARGVFAGTVDGKEGSASFTYVAHVEAGGNVNGDIVFGQGLKGQVQVTGNFADGELKYRGRVAR